MSDTTTAPIYTPAPTGPMTHILRRMLRKPLTTSLAGGRIVGDVGGEQVSAQTIDGLLSREVIAEAGSTALVTTYVLTESGRKWATGEIK